MRTLPQPAPVKGRRIVQSEVLEELLHLAAEKLADRAEMRLGPATIAKMEQEAIDKRVGRLTLEEARTRLGCGSIRALKELLRAKNIPLRRWSRSRQWVLLADIERADEVNREGGK